MRDLKFRAWDKRQKKYIVPNRLALDDDGALDFYVYNGGGYALECFIVEQYTGLKDKNGKEIYEGDIVKAKIQGIWETGPDTVYRGKAVWNLEVVYNEIRYMDVFHILGSKNSPDRIYYLFDDKLSELEVIGNIHENPELVGGEG